jgi:hypothetical protein
MGSEYRPASKEHRDTNVFDAISLNVSTSWYNGFEIAHGDCGKDSIAARWMASAATPN